MATDKIQRNKVLLWTNPDPSQLVPDTVNLSLSGYDSLEFECLRTDNLAQTYLVKSAIGASSSSPVVTDLTNVRIEPSNGGLNSITIMSRIADVYSTGVVFHDANMIYNGTTYAGWNNRAIVYRIWGIRN